jgi:crotonobetainyl-CoA:carnitine CoA-transferase CaiB-like acyl-CoA transferase
MQPHSDKPLAGLRLIDLTRLLPGPAATQYLADLGAEVLKIEDRAQGDYARRFGLGDGDTRTSPFFSAINRGKQTLRLDLRDGADRARFIDEVARSDAVIESFRPGVMQRLGLGYDELQQHRPQLVYCAISGFGQHGPQALQAGHDINYLAAAGALEALTAEDGTPVLPNIQLADLMGGALIALTGMLAALLGARLHGRGRFIDVSMTDGVLLQQWLPLYALNLHGRTRPPGRDLLNGGVPCYGLYRCGDGLWLAVGALELKFWRALCQVLGRPDWCDAHWSLGQSPGSEAALKLRDELRAVFASRPRAHWLERFAQADACVTPVLRFDEALAQARLRRPGLVRQGAIGGFELQWFDSAALWLGPELR